MGKSKNRSAPALLAQLQNGLGEALLDADFGMELLRITRGLQEREYPRGKREMVRLVFDDDLEFEIDVGDRLGVDVFHGQHRELLTLETCIRTLQKGDTVIDVGANFGFLALLAARQLEGEGRVWAFEPDPPARSMLQRNIELNPAGALVSVREECVSSKKGEVRFFSAKESAFSGLADTRRAANRKELLVNAVSLDEFSKEESVENLAFVKIDVEGFEYEVLEGAQRLLARFPDALVLFEVSPKNLNEERAKALVKVIRKYRRAGWRVYEQSLTGGQVEEVAKLNEIPGTSHDLILARPDTPRLQGLVEARQEMMREVFLPSLIRRYQDSTSSGGLSRAEQALWQAFLLELGHDFQGKLFKASQQSIRDTRRNAELSKELEISRAAQSEKEGAIEQLQDQLTELRQQMEQTEVQRKSREADNRLLKEDNPKLQQLIKDLNGSLVKSAGVVEELESKLEQTRQEKLKLTEELTGSIGREKEGVVAAKQVSAELELLKADNPKLQKLIQKLNEKIEVSAEVVGALKGKLAQVRGQKVDLTQELASSIVREKAAVLAMERMNVELELLKADNPKLRGLIKELNEKLKMAAESVGSLKGKLEEVGRQNQNLAEDLAKSHRREQKALQLAKQTDGELKFALEKIECSDRELLGERENSEQVSFHLTELQQKLKAETQDACSVRAELQLARQEAVALGQSVAAAKTQTRQLQEVSEQAHEQWESERRRLVEVVSGYERQKTKMVDQLHETEKILKITTAQLAELQREKTELEQRLDATWDQKLKGLFRTVRSG